MEKLTGLEVARSLKGVWESAVNLSDFGILEAGVRLDWLIEDSFPDW